MITRLQITTSRFSNLIIIVNIFAISFYFTISIKFDFYKNLERSFWSSSMTGPYIDFADFIFSGFKGKPPYGSSYRPFLYPLILGTFRYLSGTYSLKEKISELHHKIKRLKTGHFKSKPPELKEPESITETNTAVLSRLDFLENQISRLKQELSFLKKRETRAVWFFQFLLWMGAVNLVMVAIGRFTRTPLFVFVACGIFITNISLISHTFYAITETVLIFLLSGLMYVCVAANMKRLGQKESFLITFILSILTVLKPIFQFHLILFLFYILIRDFRKPKTVMILLIGLVPNFQYFGYRPHYL